MLKAELKEGKLYIEIDIQEPVPSKTGKTMTIASTRGNAVTQIIVHGQPLIIGLNAYIKR
jgi:hypothetical protein